MDCFDGDSKNQASEVTKIRVSHEEILAAKAEIRRAGSEAYVKLVRVTHHQSIRNRLKVIHGSETLLRVRDILAWFYPLLVLFIPLAIVFIAPWWFALVVLVALFLLLNSLQGEINLEIAARFLVVNRKSNTNKRTEIDKERPDI